MNGPEGAQTGEAVMAADIGRLLTAMVTPFDEGGEVDYEQAKRLARALVDSGSDGVVVAGTTGESPTLTPEEESRLFAEVREALDGRGCVVAGTGSNNTREALKYTRNAEKAGVDAALLVVPYYNKPTQEGLYEHFRAIAESTSLPCILYNVPSRTITNLSAETTIRLSQIPNVVGVKEASADFEQIGAIIRDSRPGFRVWSGNDADTFHILCMGGYGVISVASHLVGRQIKGMIQMLLDGSLDGRRQGAPATPSALQGHLCGVQPHPHSVRGQPGGPPGGQPSPAADGAG